MRPKKSRHQVFAPLYPGARVEVLVLEMRVEITDAIIMYPVAQMDVMYDMIILIPAAELRGGR